MTHTITHRKNAEMQECIEACTNCEVVCLETATHCLEQGGEHAEAHHIGLLQDCADICSTSARFMIRGSELHTETCRACAAVCRACAESCSTFKGDEMMERCAKVCRECADSCAEMAAA
jgi:hypothetical protein